MVAALSSGVPLSTSSIRSPSPRATLCGSPFKHLLVDRSDSRDMLRIDHTTAWSAGLTGGASSGAVLEGTWSDLGGSDGTTILGSVRCLVHDRRSVLDKTGGALRRRGPNAG